MKNRKCEQHTHISRNLDTVFIQPCEWTCVHSTREKPYAACFLIHDLIQARGDTQSCSWCWREHCRFVQSLPSMAYNAPRWKFLAAEYCCTQALSFIIARDNNNWNNPTTSTCNKSMLWKECLSACKAYSYLEQVECQARQPLPSQLALSAHRLTAHGYILQLDHPTWGWIASLLH